MPSHAESISTLNQGMAVIEDRLAAMEDRRTEAEARLAALKEKRASDVEQMMASIEALTKSVEGLRASHDRAAIRDGKQPIHQGVIPTPPHTPLSMTAVAHPHQVGSGLPIHRTYPDCPEKHLKTPNLGVPIFSGEDVDGWLFQLSSYFEMNDIRPDQMVKITSLFMSGEALRWYQYKHSTGQLSTWEQLAEDARRRFGRGEYYNPEVALQKLVQTSSVTTYIHTFERLSFEAPRLRGESLLNRFLAGLKEEVHNEIILLQPKTLDQAMSMAKIAEDKLQTWRNSFSKLVPAKSSPGFGTRRFSEPMKPSPTSLPIKRLTATEMAARREKGLCFNCDERFTPGHHCKLRFQCLIMNDVTCGEQLDAEECAAVEVPEVLPDETLNTCGDNAADNDQPCITFHALQGKSAPSTLRFQASIKGQMVLVLVDSGSTHNFLQTRLARHLKLPIEATPHLNVIVGNGDEMKCEGMCRQVEVKIGHNIFPVDLHLLPVFGADLVLGTQWLSDVGPTTCSHRELWMSFQWQGKTLTLHGLRGDDGPAPLSAKQAHKTAQNRGALYALQVISEWRPNEPDDHLANEVIPELALPTQLEPKDMNSLHELLQHYKEIFALPRGLPPPRQTDHCIPLIEGAQPVNVRPYRYPHYQKSEIEKLIQDMLREGVIRPSRSPFSSPVLLVRKKDGTWRFCVDYRALNAITVKDRFPIPTVEELLDELHGARIFTKLDLRAGYHQLRVSPADVYKTAFRTHEGHYEFLVMPFGLTNAPSSFQSEMNLIFQPLLRRCVLVFFDDILIYSATVADHLQHLRKVLHILKLNSFYVKPSKCDVARDTVEYLGHVINGEGVSVDPKKIEAVLGWPRPRTIKQLRGFLGLTGYYRRFVRHYASLAEPLTQLLRKENFIWSDTASVAFEELRRAMTSTPVLALPDFTKSFVVQTDASGTGIGAILSQDNRPLAYFSKQLSPRLQASSAYNRELCALVLAIQKWRQYLLGTRFIIETDHKPLKGLLSQTILNPEQQHWTVKLLGYDFEVRYKPGKDNGPADALSRLHENRDENSPSEQPACHALLGVSKPEYGILRALRRYYINNVDGKLLMEEVKNGSSRGAKYKERDGLLLINNVIHVPEETALKELIMFEFHNTASGGHPGVQRTLARISACFHWVSMRSDVKEYVKRCETCQRVKANNSAPAGLLQPLPMPEHIWEELSMDFVTHLPPSSGKTVIMVVVDRLSKGAHFSALKNGFSAKDVFKIFISDVVKLHGFPKNIVSDRDPIFMSELWRGLFKRQGTVLANSSSYHPQSDGQTEVVNRSLEDYLRCFVGERQSDWVTFLPWAEYSYNTAFHSSIGMSPFEAMFGRPPPTILEHVKGSTSVVAIEDLLLQRDQVLRRLKENLARAQHRMQLHANKHRQNKSFVVGDWVWLRLQPHRQNSVRPRLTNKLAKRYYGPFKILARIGAVAYRLELPPHAKIHNVFHVSLLRQFVGDPSAVQQAFPTQFVGHMPLLSPERVLGHRVVEVQGQWRSQVLVKWLDIPADEATWEYTEDMGKEFPDFNLEDKVVVHGGGNDTRGIAAAAEEDAPLRRGTRPRQDSRKYSTNEYQLG